MGHAFGILLAHVGSLHALLSFRHLLPWASQLSIPMQLIPLSVLIVVLFTRDKEAFCWKHFTDEELELRRMDVWELAKVIDKARVNNLSGEQEKLIVA